MEQNHLCADHIFASLNIASFLLKIVTEPTTTRTNGTRSLISAERKLGSNVDASTSFTT